VEHAVRSNDLGPRVVSLPTPACMLLKIEREIVATLCQELPDRYLDTHVTNQWTESDQQAS
jgi:hypothetical protein